MVTIEYTEIDEYVTCGGCDIWLYPGIMSIAIHDVNSALNGRYLIPIQYTNDIYTVVKDKVSNDNYYMSTIKKNMLWSFSISGESKVSKSSVTIRIGGEYDAMNETIRLSDVAFDQLCVLISFVVRMLSYGLSD